MRPIDWRGKLLRRHGLEQPDGRPLYQYRITDQEFNELKELLVISGKLGIQNVNRLLMWDSTVVFYASEWWRRYYAGQWGWDGVFNSLGMDVKNITTARRNDLVETGLRHWRRDVRKLEGRHQFLGTVATEGGLPLHQLSEAGGWLNNLLRPVLKKHLQRGLDVGVLIDSYQDIIPSSYRSAEIKQILEDMVNTIVDLRKTHILEDKENPIQWLDINAIGWRDKFPLPVESEVASALLGDLINVAATSKLLSDKDPDQLFQLERYLVNTDHQPELQAKLEMPSFVPLAILKGIESRTLPGRVELGIKSDDNDYRPWCRAIPITFKNEPCFKLTGQPIYLKDEFAIKEYKLCFKAMGEILYEMPISDAQRLDIDIPWLFKQVDERWDLHGVASQSIKSDEALVYIPSQYSIEKENEATEVGEFKNFHSGKLFRLKGEIKCHKDYDKYKFSTGQDETFLQYELRGKYFNGASNPAATFIGMPELIERNTITGHVRKVSGDRIRVKPSGIANAIWKPLSDENMGVYELRVQDSNGNLCCRRRIGLLGDDYSCNLVPNRGSVQRGQIELSGLGDAHVSANGLNCDISVKAIEGKTIVSVETKTMPPRNLNFNILPLNHKHELMIELPYPSKGSLLFDAKDKPICEKNPLYLNNLYGYRLRFFSENFGPNCIANINFKLNDGQLSGNENRDLYIDKAVTIHDQLTELSLIDWRETIESLMGVSTSLDSTVKVMMIMNGAEQFSLTFKRYEYELEPDWKNGSVSLSAELFASLDTDIVAGASLHAIWLNQPEQGEAVLSGITSEGCQVGVWPFHPDKREHGPWLIFPAKESTLQFRPMLWVVGENADLSVAFEQSVHSLQRAIRLGDKDQREEAIRLVLSQMAIDLDHKSWDYLENLTRKCGHLPLSTFDVWRIAISQTPFLAALLVKKGFEDIIERLESELPVIWEMVPIKHWYLALNEFRSRLIKTVQGDDGIVSEEDNLMIEKILLKRIERIQALSQSMQSVAAILRLQLLNMNELELNKFKKMPDSQLKQLLSFTFQNVLRTQSEKTWPVLLSKQLKSILNAFPDRLKASIHTHNDFQAPVAYIPLVLAWYINLDDKRIGEKYRWLGDPVNIFKIRQLKNFDEGWFSDAFQFLSGWVSQQLLNNDEKTL